MRLRFGCKKWYIWGKRRFMRLAAIYIKEHYLFDKPQTINFGGKNMYSFNTVDNKPDEIEITKVENQDFMDGFRDRDQRGRLSQATL